MFNRPVLTLVLACSGALLFASTAATAGNGGATDIATTRVADGLGFTVGITHAPGDPTRLFILEKPGVIKILNLETGTVNPTPFLNINGDVGGGTSFNDERGLLGLAFHPNYQENGYFYVNFTANNGATTIRRYKVSKDPDIASVGSGSNILLFSQPFANHNGGWIGFGPDGYLYIATGDGGSGGDPQDNGQTLDTLLGKMLRIDVDNTDQGLNYGIPDDNPFVGEDGRDEIWAYGLRNPWRSSFDRETGDLYIGDVGQGSQEELNFQPASSTGGENYGWRCYEGNNAFNLTGCPPASTMVFPFHAYPTNCAVTGGYVYRGCDIPSLRGTYFFADFCSAQIWSLEPEYDGKEFDFSNFQTRTSQLSPSIEGFSISWISSFGEDANGELYIAAQGFGSTGSIFKVIPEPGSAPVADLNCDGSINVLDMLQLLGAWGACEDCPEDLNEDGQVNVLDLLELLGQWG